MSAWPPAKKRDRRAKACRRRNLGGRWAPNLPRRHRGRAARAKRGGHGAGEGPTRAGPRWRLRVRAKPAALHRRVGRCPRGLSPLAEGVLGPAPPYSAELQGAAKNSRPKADNCRRGVGRFLANIRARKCQAITLSAINFCAACQSEFRAKVPEIGNASCRLDVCAQPQNGGCSNFAHFPRLYVVVVNKSAANGKFRAGAMPLSRERGLANVVVVAYAGARCTSQRT